MTTDREKALDKIRKCLALGKSPNEHEAAAALRQAQKLMAMHNLSEDDVGLMEFAYETIVTDYEFGRRKPMIVVAVIQVVSHALGVEAVMGGTRKTDGGEMLHSVRYFGPRARVALATHAHRVIYRACGTAWRAYSRGRTMPRGARASFYYGWCQAVQEKVQALALSKDEVEGIAKKKAQVYGRELDAAKCGTKSVYGDIAGAGAMAASDFDLHRPVGTERNRLEHK